jgi:hypothetical protein
MQCKRTYVNFEVSLLPHNDIDRPQLALADRFYSFHFRQFKLPHRFLRAPGADGAGKFTQQWKRIVPADASIGDALTVRKRLPFL